MVIADGFIYACLLAILLITLFRIQASISRLEQKVKRLELSLSLLLNRMEIEVPSRLSERVKQMALDPYRKIEAIKSYREENGTGLKEAKEAIEDFLDNNK